MVHVAGWEAQNLHGHVRIVPSIVHVSWVGSICSYVDTFMCVDTGGMDPAQHFMTNGWSEDLRCLDTYVDRDLSDVMRFLKHAGQSIQSSSLIRVPSTQQQQQQQQVT